MQKGKRMSTNEKCIRITDKAPTTETSVLHNDMHDDNQNKLAMGDDVEKPYIVSKVHHCLLNKPYSTVTVRGSFARSDNAIIGREKEGKPFNWMRPTLTIDANNNQAFLNCVPGVNYTYHYYGILDKYYTQYYDQDLVKPKLTLADVTTNQTDQFLMTQTNLPYVPTAKVYVMGIVHHFVEENKFNSHIQNTKNIRSRGPFLWYQQQNVVFLGCQFSMFGDIGGQIAKYLVQQKHAKQIIYLGKVGSLKENLLPNQTICSGDNSDIDGKHVTFDNIFKNACTATDVDYFDCASHINVQSVLKETVGFVQNHYGHFDIVDSDIGKIAAACTDCGANFSYLAPISDSLLANIPEYRSCNTIISGNLANEREMTVVRARYDLYRKMKNILHIGLERIRTV